MQATRGEHMQSAGNGVSSGGVPPATAAVGWVYLQPMQMGPSPQMSVSYPQKQWTGLGAAQIVLGGLCIVFNAVTLGVYGGGISLVGHGFWCGVLFIVTGAIGISAGTIKTKCKVVSYMVMCIISAAFTAALLSCGVLSAVIIGYNVEDCQRYGYSSNYRTYYYRTPCSTYQTGVAMEACMAICALIAAILFIWGSALCCKANPCCGHDYSVQPMLLPQYNVANNNLQMIPTMPCYAGAPPAYQPNLTPQAMWMQPQLVQGNVAATAAAPTSYPSSYGVRGQNSEPPHKQ